MDKRTPFDKWPDNGMRPMGKSTDAHLAPYSTGKKATDGLTAGMLPTPNAPPPLKAPPVVGGQPYDRSTAPPRMKQPSPQAPAPNRPNPPPKPSPIFAPKAYERATPARMPSPAGIPSGQPRAATAQPIAAAKPVATAPDQRKPKRYTNITEKDWDDWHEWYAEKTYGADSPQLVMEKADRWHRETKREIGEKAFNRIFRTTPTTAEGVIHQAYDFADARAEARRGRLASEALRLYDEAQGEDAMLRRVSYPADHGNETPSRPANPVQSIHTDTFAQILPPAPSAQQGPEGTDRQSRGTGFWPDINPEMGGGRPYVPAAQIGIDPRQLLAAGDAGRAAVQAIDGFLGAKSAAEQSAALGRLDSILQQNPDLAKDVLIAIADSQPYDMPSLEDPDATSLRDLQGALKYPTSMLKGVAMSLVGLTESGRNLRHFLFGEGEPRMFDRLGALAEPTVAAAEQKVKNSFAEGFLADSGSSAEALMNLGDGETIQLSEEWVSAVKQGSFDHSLSIGGSNLAGYGLLTASRDGDTIKISGPVLFSYFDTYDFEMEDGLDMISTEEYILQQTGQGHPFRTGGQWHQMMDATFKMEEGKLVLVGIEWRDE